MVNVFKQNSKGLLHNNIVGTVDFVKDSIFKYKIEFQKR